jgi:predicted phage tail protein
MLTRGRPGPANQVNPANLVGYDRIIFLMVMGLAFISFGLYFFGEHGPNWFLVAIGLAFFIFGISQFFMTKKFRKQFRDKKG